MCTNNIKRIDNIKKTNKSVKLDVKFYYIFLSIILCLTFNLRNTLNEYNN